MTARARDARTTALDEAAGLILAGRYIPGETDVALATRHGLTAAQVVEVRREAARHCAVLSRRSPEEHETRLERTEADYRRLYVAALDSDDIATAKGVLDSLVKLLGLAAPTRSELTVKTEVDQYATLPVEERLRIARDVVAEWSGEVARLEAELGVVTMLGEGER